MRNQDQNPLWRPRSRSTNVVSEPATGPAQYFEVAVIFTTCESTRRALQAAGNLARDLGVRINFIIPRTVPYAFPLTRPPVSAAFTEQRFAAIARDAGENSEIDVLICNCWDPKRALAKILRPHSLVMIGGKKRWWPTKATTLAAHLRSAGHEVILTEQSEGSHARSFLCVRLHSVFRCLLGLHPGL